MKPRILVLLVAAILIAWMTYDKMSRTYPPRSATATRYPLGSPPLFEAQDVNNRFFRLNRYVGRHSFFVVFFDAERGATQSPVLNHLKSHDDELRSRNMQVVGVSSALPQHNRNADFPDSFVLVTDPEPFYLIHRDWGSFNEGEELPVETVFFVDRAGRIQIHDGKPIPLSDAAHDIDRLLGLEAH